MDLDQLRFTLATTGRVEIRRHVGKAVGWVLGYLVLAAVGGVIVVGGLADRGPVLVVLGLTVLVPSMGGITVVGPVLLGRSTVVVDATGIRVGRRLAPWSQIAAVEARIVVTPGVRQTLTVVRDHEGRTPFHAPGRRAPWWPWRGRVMPRALRVRQPDLVVLLSEQLAVHRSGTRPVIAPPLHD